MRLCLLQEGKVEAYVKSDEIPEKNDEPVKVVVRKSFNQMVLDSKKNGIKISPVLLCYS